MDEEPKITFPHVEKAYQYCEDVLNSKIRSCEQVEQACQRFFDDLEKEDDPDWPFYFDEDAAARPCRFAETFNHVKIYTDKIELEPWQCFIVCNIFGWKKKKDNYRRFTEADLIIPRKNGKSLLGAVIGLYLLTQDGEQGAEIYSGATSEKQSWEIFGPALQMAKKNKKFREVFGVMDNASNLYVAKTHSKFEPVIGNPGDGSNPHGSLIDEFHEHRTNALYATMQTGMGARRQPLMLIVTTAGFDLSSPCYNLVLEGRRILSRQNINERVFYIEYTIDSDVDWASRDAIFMANPNINVSVQEEYLLARQQEAINNTQKQGFFQTKYLNKWLQAKNQYFNMENFKKGYRKDLSENSAHLQRSKCVLGFDLASKQDIAATVMLFPHKDGTFTFLHKLYLPEKVTEEVGFEHYAGWVQEGKIIATPGNMISHQEIKDDADQLCKQFEVTSLAFDPAGAAWMMGSMMDEGKPVVDVPQSSIHLSEPMRMLSGLIDDGKIFHNCTENDPFTWMMANVVNRTTRRDLDHPEKERPQDKIDGPVALMIAMSQCLYMTDETSMYETKTIDYW